MTIYRGPGGTGSATSDADTTLYQDFLNQTEAAKNAAAVSATNASTSASTAATQASNAASSASAASGSASAAAASASTASTKASEASASASSASVSAAAADASAVSAAASAASINPALFMHLAGTETVTGSKTFSSLITGDISGTASNVTGTVAAANGGTGLTSVGTSGNVLTSNGTAWVSQAPTVAVTSVGATAPVSSSGGTTPNISLASGYGDTQNPFASKTANSFLAAPNGTAGAPSFRAIVAADIPTLNQNTTGTASNVTGTVAVANGGTGSTTLAANNVLLGNGTSALQAVAPGASGNLLTSNGTTWVSSAPPSGGQYYGSAATKAIAYNSDTIGENITISAGTNGLSAGPITINTGFTVTVNGTWTIV